MNKMISLLKVEFSYTSTNEEELTVIEDQLVYLLDSTTDSEWYKVKIKSTSPTESLIGLVPASYLTTPEPLKQIQILYSYTPTLNESTGELENEEELQVTEGEIMDLWEEEGDWSLVGRREGEEGVGWVPASYVGEVGEHEAEIEPEQEEEPQQQEEDIYEEPSPSLPTRPKVSIPVSTYIDPSERVAATKSINTTNSGASKPKMSEVKTWSVSEVDKKKKKKKGTLGVGNGTVFFASESDKTPVQQYSLSNLSDIKSEKSKHLFLTFKGEEEDLHFTISTKESFDEIVSKIESDRDLAKQSSPTSTTPNVSASNPRTVNFPALPSSSSNSPSTSTRPIPTPQSTSTSAYTPPPPPVRSASASNTITKSTLTNGNSVALYDFTPQGSDELNISEGERLIFVENGSDDTDWVKVKKLNGGEEGVVPASYVERDVVSSPPASTSTTNNNSNRRYVAPSSEDEEEERLSASDALNLKNQLQSDARRQKELENSRRGRLSIAPPVAPIPVPSRVDIERDGRDVSGAGKKDKGREVGKKPATHRVRTWKDRTGQFKVEAEFLGLNANKIRLHKLNGVIIEVPIEKMSSEDTAYLKRVTGGSGRGDEDDDVPLSQFSGGGTSEERRNERHRRGELAANAASGNSNGNNGSSASNSNSRRKTSSQPAPIKTKTQPIDFFDFFLSAGCDMHDCTRYATNFEKERIDLNLLLEIDNSTLRTLGLREGDIIRVLKFIRTKYGDPNALPPPTPEKSDKDARLAIDASFAKSLGTPTLPAPNLFTTGPEGGLKSTRRGRPNRSNSNANATVDSTALANAGNELARRNSPAINNSTSSAPTARISSPPLAAVASNTNDSKNSGLNGFDDDAWTVKGSKSTTTPLIIPTTPNSTIASLPVATTIVSPISEPQRSGSAGLPTSTLSYNDGLLAQLGIGARPPSAPVGTSQSPGYPTLQPQQALSQQQQLQQLQQTSTTYSQAPSPIAYAPAGPRAAITPIPANQGLLTPLIPTVTGMPMSMGMGFRSPYTQTPMMPQMTGYIPQPQQQQQQQQMSQMGMIPQMTGYPMPISMQQPMSQQFTGMPNRNVSPFANPQPQPSFLQSQPTGMPNYLQPQSTGYQQPPQQQPYQQPVPNRLVEFNPLPPTSQPQSMTPSASTTSAQFTPSNVFASMKGGQDANKYDALRPQGQVGFQPQQQMMQPQQTGFGMPQQQQQQQFQQQQQQQQQPIFPQQTGYIQNNGRQY